MKKLDIALIVAALTLGSVATATAQPAAQPAVVRISGSTAVATAVAIASKSATKPGGVVFLANDRNAADALAAAPAAAHGQAPVLLTEPDSLPPVTWEKLSQLAPSQVVIQGGGAAVSPGVVAAVSAAVPGVVVTRNSGPTAIDTAVKTAEFIDEAAVVFVANHASYADALPGAAVAGSLAAPVLLTEANLPVAPSVLTKIRDLKASKIVVLGGRAAISDAVVREFEKLAPVTRLAGRDATDTAVQIANYLPQRKTATVATAYGFADALAAAPLAASENGVILLSGPQCLPGPAWEWLRAHPVPRRLVGGQLALSDTVLTGRGCHPTTLPPVDPSVPELPEPTIAPTPSETPAPIPTDPPTDPPAPEIPTPETPAIDALLANQPNQNITHYQRDNSRRTVLWVAGITGPDPTGFKEVNDGTYRYDVTPWQPGLGWYDADKRVSDTANDQVLCSAAVAANLLHWWLDQNRDNVDQFLQDPNHGVITSAEHGRIDIRDLRQFKDQQDSGIYSLFVSYFGPSGAPVYADHTMDLFLNGYASPGQGVINSAERFVADDRGGFLFPAVGKEVFTDRSGVRRYAGFDLRVRQWLSNGRAVAVSHTTLNALLGHIITVWGAEFSDDGKVQAIYTSDSDDRWARPAVLEGAAIGMKRIEVRPDSQGLTRLTTNPAPNTGAKALELFSLRSGPIVWPS